MTDEVEDIEIALDVLLRVALDADDQAAMDRREGDRALGEIAAEFLSMTPLQRRAAGLTRNPVGASARAAVGVLGERLHELGGVQAMTDVCERVAPLEPDRQERRTAIMDRAWNGVGSWLS